MSELGSTFFPSQRKEITLNEYKQFQVVDPKSPNSTMRAKRLTLEMEFDSAGKNLSSMLGWISAAYTSLQEDGLLQKRIIFAPEKTLLRGMTVEIYKSPDSNEREHLLTGCECSHFYLERAGTPERPRYLLRFRVESPDTLNFHLWLQTHYASTFYCSFVQGQETFNFETADPAAPETEEEQMGGQATDVPTFAEDSEEDEEDEENANTLSPDRDAEFHPTAAVHTPRTRKGNRKPLAGR